MKIGSIISSDKLLADLRRAVYSLNFVDNFRAWQATVTIPANTEVAISNQFVNGAIPSKWLIVDHQGNGIIVRGDSPWTRDLVYLKNRSANDAATVTVVFFSDTNESPNTVFSISGSAGSIGGQVITLTGDVTGSGTGTFATTISNDAVTYAKMQNVSATNRILGRKTSGVGDVEECTLSEALDFIGSAAQGDILYRGASSWTRLGAGSAGQLLRTSGAGANPQWVAAREVLTGARTYFVGFNLGTATMGSSSTVTVNNHGLTSGAPIVFSGTTAPTGITFGTVYFASVLTANTFTIFTTSALTTQVTYTGSGTNVIVRTGNDNNPGFGTNGPTTALLTLQKAIDLAAAIDSSIFDVTIQVCDGLHSHVGTIDFKTMGGAGKIIIIGNTTTPANCTFRLLSGASLVQFRSFYVSTIYDVRGLTLETNQASIIGISVVGGSILLSFMRFGLGTQPYLFIIISQFGGLLDVVNDCTFTNIGNGAVCAFDSGSVRLFNPSTGLLTLFIQNTPSAGIFFRLRNCGVVIIGGVGVVDGDFAGTPPGSPNITVSGNSVVNGGLLRGLNTLGLCTFTIGTPGLVNFNAHGLAANAEVRFTTTGTLANPLLINTSYYVTAANLTANSFAVSATPGGAQINFTTAGTGNNTLLFRQSAFTQTVTTGGQVY